MYETRKKAAATAFAEYDFEPDVVKDTGGWESGENILFCNVYLEGEGDKPSKKVTFVVFFHPGTAEVKDVCCH